MGFETYLIENTNQLHNLTIQARVLPRQEGQKVLEAAVIGCETLERLVSDKSFYRTVDSLFAARFAEREYGEETFRQHDRIEFRKLVDAEDSFEDFLRIEYEIMIKGGLFPDIAAELIGESRRALKKVRERALPPSDVILAVTRLRDQACYMARDLRAQAAEDRTWEKWKDIFKRISKGIAGGALVIVNAVTFISTAKTSAAQATGAMGALSTYLGAEIVKDAAMPQATVVGA